jgi:hypothetical protein
MPKGLLAHEIVQTSAMGCELALLKDLAEVFRCAVIICVKPAKPRHPKWVALSIHQALAYVGRQGRLFKRYK